MATDTASAAPTDAELFPLIEKHFGMVPRRDDTVIDWRTLQAIIDEALRSAPTPDSQPSENCRRCKGSGEDPEGFYDQSRGPDGDTHDGPCRTCGGTGAAQPTPPAVAPSEWERFERHVKAYTGRDMAYHERNGTTGLEFGWACWKAARRVAPTPPAVMPKLSINAAEALMNNHYTVQREFGKTVEFQTMRALDMLREAFSLGVDAARAAPPAVVEPMTPIRAAAFDLYTPPFRHDHGYIRDSNHQMVADDAGDTMAGVIAARIRGWGRIQYMDSPERRAGALQDEVAEMVADALNRYWAAHGIDIKKGAQDGTL